MTHPAVGKVARSWASQVALMEEYDELHFTASSAQQYYWLETRYPKLFKRIKAKVHDGKFQYIGGSAHKILRIPYWS